MIRFCYVIFKEGATRSMGTTIYYLLDPNQPRGRIHRNLSQVRYYPMISR